MGLSITRAARLVGVSPGHLGNIERDRVPVSGDALTRLATLYGMNFGKFEPEERLKIRLTRIIELVLQLPEERQVQVLAYLTHLAAWTGALTVMLSRHLGPPS